MAIEGEGRTLGSPCPRRIIRRRGATSSRRGRGFALSPTGWSPFLFLVAAGVFALTFGGYGGQAIAAPVVERSSAAEDRLAEAIASAGSSAEPVIVVVNENIVLTKALPVIKGRVVVKGSCGNDKSGGGSRRRRSSRRERRERNGSKLTRGGEERRRSEGGGRRIEKEEEEEEEVGAAECGGKCVIDGAGKFPIFVGANATANGGGCGMIIENLVLQNAVGGIVSGMCDLKVTRCILRNNTKRVGAAITVGGGSGSPSSTGGAQWEVNGCVFEDNVASGLGGGAIFSASAAGGRVVRSVFRRNSAPSGNGGALFLVARRDDTWLDRATFESNMASDNGGAIFVYGFDSFPRKVFFIKSSFSMNVAACGYGGAIALHTLVDARFCAAGRLADCGNRARQRGEGHDIALLHSNYWPPISLSFCPSVLPRGLSLFVTPSDVVQVSLPTSSSSSSSSCDGCPPANLLNLTRPGRFTRHHHDHHHHHQSSSSSFSSIFE